MLPTSSGQLKHDILPYRNSRIIQGNYMLSDWGSEVIGILVLCCGLNTQEEGQPTYSS
jgi:hypothetical protein